MKYVLPVIVNNRRTHILNLHKRKRRSDNNYTIEIDSTNQYNKISLFRVHKNTSVNALVNNKTDFEVGNCEVYVAIENNNIIIDFLHNNEKNDEEGITSIGSIENFNFFLNNTDEEFEVYFEIEDEKEIEEDTEIRPDQVTITVRTVDLIDIDDEQDEKLSIDDDKIKYTASMQFHFCHITNHIKTVLDFGSEASQLYNVTNDGYRSYHSSESLLQIIKMLYNKDQDTDSSFVQYEKDTNFLRSIFYIKKLLSKRVNKDLINNDDLSLLAKKTEIQSDKHLEDWHQVPNLKITHKHAKLLNQLKFNEESRTGKLNSPELSELKSKVLSTILKRIIDAYLQYSYDKVHRNKYYYRFTLLIPNIYDIDTVNQLKRHIHNIFDTANKELLDGSLKAWEIITLSESDASLLGYYSTHEEVLKPDKYYIAIDCGKGTTDFSVIKAYKDHHEVTALKPVYRNGFAGAGNLISYAFFESMVCALIKNANSEKNATNKIIELFEQPDRKKILDIYEQVERLKYKYDSNIRKEIVDESWGKAKDGNYKFANAFDNQFLESISLDPLIKMISQVDALYDWKDYIQNAVQEITTNILEGVNDIIKALEDTNIKCGGVLLTGRGLLFKPLKEMLISALIEKHQGVLKEELIQIPDDRKSRMKDICITGVYASDYLINDELVGTPIPMIENGDDSKYKKLKTKLRKLITDSILSNSNVEDNTFHVPNDKDFSFRFKIGGQVYKLKGGAHTLNCPEDGKPEGVYANDKFYIRCLVNGVVKSFGELEPILDEITDEDKNNNVQKSLFPGLFDVKKLQSIKDCGGENAYNIDELVDFE